MDNQDLKLFFSKPKLSRREPKLLETLANFETFSINLKSGKINFPVGALSREQKAENAFFNDIEVCYIIITDIISWYGNNHLFGLLYAS